MGGGGGGWYPEPHNEMGENNIFDNIQLQKCIFKKNKLIEQAQEYPDVNDDPNESIPKNFFCCAKRLYCKNYVYVMRKKTIWSHENKKPLNPFYHKKYFWQKVNVMIKWA